jgi:GT2 family glycosyltransferase
MTKVSIILPFHKVNPFLDEAIDSVLESDYGDYELLLVSDGVEDTELEKISAQVKRPKVRLLHNPGTGLVDALNFGVTVSQAQYVARMDSDDLCYKSRLSKQVQFLDRNPRVDLVGAQIRLICDHGVPKSGGRRYPKNVMRGPLPKPFTCEVAHPTVMFRRRAFEDAGGYRNFYTKSEAEDLDLWNRILRNGRMANLNEILLDYRVHASQISSSRATEQRLSTEVATLLDIWEMYSTTNEDAPFFSSGAEAFDWLTSTDQRQNLVFFGKLRHRSFIEISRTSHALSRLAALAGIGSRVPSYSNLKSNLLTLVWETIRNPVALVLVLGAHLGSLRNQVFSTRSPVCQKCKHPS